MVLIDGVGDEVTFFFSGLLMFLIGLFAWWTTNTSDHRYFHTVWLLDRRRNFPADTSSSSARSDMEASSNEQSQPVDNSTQNDNANDLLRLRQRRLQIFESSAEPPIGDSNTDNDLEPAHNEVRQADSVQQNVEDSPTIRIKLKYLNDELRVVDGKLQEKLGDFKRRHFTAEYQARNLVRLIFNGQVLQQDTATLEHCGLFDNCVVHCIIHQRRVDNANNNQNDEAALNAGQPLGRPRPGNSPTRDWDLGNCLFSIISVLLLFAWYFRYVYTHLYTVVATVGLIVVTAVFSLIFFGTYLRNNESA